MLVGEEVGDLVDVVLVLEEAQGGEKGGPAQLRHGDASAPRPVHRVEDPSYHLQGGQRVYKDLLTCRQGFVVWLFTRIY